MSILTTIEAKSTKGRIFQAGVFLALVIGSITMVYPFVLMLSGALRSDMDVNEMTAVPAFFRDDSVLIRKFLKAKFNYNVTEMNRLRQSQGYDFAQLDVPNPPSNAQANDFHRFVQETDIPDHWWVLGGTRLYKETTTPILRELQARIRAHYEGDLHALGVDVGAPVMQWRQVTVLTPEWTSRRYGHTQTPVYEEYYRLLDEKPLAYSAFSTVTGAFLENMIYPKYGQITVDRFNAAMQNPIVSFSRFTVPSALPPESDPVLRAEWTDFVQESLHMSFIRVIGATNADYQEFLRARFQGDLGRLNARWHSTYEHFSQIVLPGEWDWVPAARSLEYEAFVQSFPLDSIRLVGPEFAWQDWLRAAYGTVDALNGAYGTDYAGWDECRIPMDHVESAFVLENTRALRRDLALNDFVNVIVAILLEGRPFFNTVVFVVLSLLFSLTIMPLAAYALSRFSPPGTWRFIMVFMATMAFPPMVGMIPQFLILRGMGLLNTFAALVLPVERLFSYRRGTTRSD